MSRKSYYPEMFQIKTDLKGIFTNISGAYCIPMLVILNPSTLDVKHISKLWLPQCQWLAEIGQSQKKFV